METQSALPLFNPRSVQTQQLMTARNGVQANATLGARGDDSDSDSDDEDVDASSPRYRRNDREPSAEQIQELINSGNPVVVKAAVKEIQGYKVPKEGEYKPWASGRQWTREQVSVATRLTSFCI